MRTTRRLGIGLGLLLGAGCLVVWLVLQSTSVQRFLYNTYAAPELETLGLSTDFSGMDYSEGEFTIAKLDLQLHQKTIATLKGVHIAEVGWRQGIVQIASISFDTINIDARDTALFSQWLRDLPSDTTTSGLPLAIANSSFEFFEIELLNDQRIQG